jgi:hypothetical protein
MTRRGADPGPTKLGPSDRPERSDYYRYVTIVT